MATHSILPRVNFNSLEFMRRDFICNEMQPKIKLSKEGDVATYYLAISPENCIKLKKI